MGFLSNNKGCIISEWFIAMHDISSVKKGSAVDISLTDYHMIIVPLLGEKNELIIAYSQITDVFYGMRSELQQKRKSLIVRTVASGLLFGNIVAVVSASNPKPQKVNKFYFAVNYIDERGEDIILWFQDTRLFKGRRLAAKLKEILEFE